MHDLDVRFENQDRIINYLIQQIGSFENAINNSNRRVSDLQERDRDSLLKVRNDLKFTNEQALRDLTDLTSKVNLLEQN